ncbi:MAG: Methyltransferase type 11 [Candidatus Uhrbacteria bacterium GW2011_GWE2_45_35]|uniref:Methyltransferase type 11 n=2 Tax=Candidatus Uhriibacteriota TaxID=1752732 RepID=A0A0G1JJ83_9BACT|nr:MAG: Methyltransferase type 11 [Candidatus Uhrbacteria bacterium GW2011_GWF2_44_350]KKU08633.1 MAG: Methyltransferase type 11 [Candidatus Uhrbacteria bacterium GW2011_GWE2_45_35]HBR80282.1 hypothetical protein [Candidatus Uhrbacteria bacterium]HCU31584.1 hypothetical protein [Candidatus Uhrbacteria bacterium]
MDLTQQSYDRIAKDWYQDNLTNENWWQVGIDFFVDCLSEGAAVLDIGCGCGEKTKYLSDRDFRVTGVDYSEGMLAEARRQYSNLKFLHLDFRQAEILGREFDGIFSLAAFLHLPKKETPETIKSLTKNECAPRSKLTRYLVD